MDCYMGTVLTFAFNYAPLYFSACNGTTMAPAQNAALFSLLGTTYGGNGSTTFNLPDLRSRTAVHYGTGPGLTTRNLGVAFGQENEALTVTQLPSHSHTIAEKTAGQTVTATTAVTVNASGVAATLPGPLNHYWAAPATGTTQTSGYNATKTVTMASDAVQVTVTPTFAPANLNVALTGASTPFSLAQPSLPLNFCICTSGLFPPRT